jgi:hypothetical protein
VAAAKQRPQTMFGFYGYLTGFDIGHFLEKTISADFG